MARHGLDRFNPQLAATDPDEPSSFAAEHRFSASTGTIDLRVLELLSAHLCHELSGPIAAISNGVELLAEEDPGLGSSPNSAFLHDAVALVSESARRARFRLQFYRFAYGFSSGSAIAGPAPHEVAISFFAAASSAAFAAFAFAVRASSCFCCSGVVSTSLTRSPSVPDEFSP